MIFIFHISSFDSKLFICLFENGGMSSGLGIPLLPSCAYDFSHANTRVSLLASAGNQVILCDAAS